MDWRTPMSKREKVIYLIAMAQGLVIGVLGIMFGQYLGLS